MAKETFQLSDDAVAVYEDQKVKSMFEPLARVTVKAIPITSDDRILDVACGTGIVLRTVHKNVVPATPMTGIDINASMIAMAKNCTQQHAEDFDWHVAYVETLPFENSSFTLLFCQQGIQYFPDQKKVLQELRRVEADGGRVVLSVWGGASDFFQAMAKSVTKHVDQETGDKYLAPFNYRDVDALPQMLVDAGFRDVDVKPMLVDRTMSEIAQNISKEILGHPSGPKVLQAGENVVEAISSEVIAACADYRKGDDMIVPQRATLFTASA